MSRAQKLFAIVLSTFSPGAGLIYLGQWRTGIKMLASWHGGFIAMYLIWRGLDLGPLAFMAGTFATIASLLASSVILLRRAWRTAAPISPVVAMSTALLGSIVATAVARALDMPGV